MPLPLLGALVVLGIGGLALTLHLMGWTRRPSYADQAAAAADFQKDYPNAEIGEVILADDGRGAFLPMKTGIGYAAPFGDGRLTRVLDRGDVRKIDEDGAGLTIRLTDYTAPRLKMSLSDPAARETIKQRLSALTEAT